MFRKYWPLFSVLGIYWATVLILIIWSIKLNEGQYVYPLDDTYIHMAIAKNWALYHVWGATKLEFTSSTSSPLWTALLAITFSAFGVNEIAPLLLNLIFGTLAIAAAYFFLVKYIHGSIKIFVLLLIMVFVTPLPTLTVSGMEHTLQTLLSLCFVFLSLPVLSQKKNLYHRNHLFLLLLAPFIVSIRYEGIFLVFMLCAIYLYLHKRILYPAAVGIAALAPVTIYGLWSIANGWFFLPNSVLLKGSFPSLSKLSRLPLETHIFILLITSLFLFAVIYQKREKSHFDKWYANLILLGTLLLHISFASFGWLYRYEAYLILLGAIVLGISADDLLSKISILKFGWKIESMTKVKPASILILLAFVFCLSPRVILSLRDSLIGMHERYLDHFQQARFVKKYYPNSTIVVNDIGALAFYTEARLLDMYGLSNIEPILYRSILGDGEYKRDDLFKWAENEGAEIAILKVQWEEVTPRIPSEWAMISEWQLPQNVVFGDTRLAIFAIDGSKVKYLSKSIRAFTLEIPEELIVVQDDESYEE